MVERLTTKVFISYKTEGLNSNHSCTSFSFVADEDLRGRNVLPLTYLLREVLKVRTSRETMYHQVQCVLYAACTIVTDFGTEGGPQKKGWPPEHFRRGRA